VDIVSYPYYPISNMFTTPFKVKNFTNTLEYGKMYRCVNHQ